MPTGIAYVDETWNPVVGCSKCSPGCLYCFAEELHNMRHQAYLAGKKVPKQYAKLFSEIQFFSERLSIPLHWRTPRRILACSMGDLFHPKVPFEFVDKVFLKMALCWGNQTYRRDTYPNHTFLILTKRVTRMAEYMSGDVLRRWGDGAPIYGPLPNIHLGVTICNQAEADKKIPILLQIPAAHRWLSIEPILDWVSPGPYFWRTEYESTNPDHSGFGEISSQEKRGDIDYVVVGCESGPKRRHCDIDQIKWVVQQCKAAGVKCWVKQIEINGKVSHKPEEWPVDLRVQEII